MVKWQMLKKNLKINEKKWIKCLWVSSGEKVIVLVGMTKETHWKSDMRENTAKKHILDDSKQTNNCQCKVLEIERC